MANSWYNIANEAGRAGATNAHAALSDNHCNGVIMPEKHDTTIMAQLASTAPNIYELLRTRPARIRASIASGDVLNGYGFSLSMTLTVEVLTDRCQSCGETQFSAPVFDCRNHRFVREWRQIADTAAPSLADALIVLDEKIEQWTERIERRTA